MTNFLINCTSTPLVHDKYPFELLFQKTQTTLIFVFLPLYVMSTIHPLINLLLEIVSIIFWGYTKRKMDGLSMIWDLIHLSQEILFYKSIHFFISKSTSCYFILTRKFILTTHDYFLSKFI